MDLVRCAEPAATRPWTAAASGTAPGRTKRAAAERWIALALALSLAIATHAAEAQHAELEPDLEPLGGAFQPQALAVDGDTLLLSAVDAEAGRELWRSDGTPGGTFRVLDLWPGPDGAIQVDAAAVLVDGVLFFAANGGAAGIELWRSDGTAPGTWRIRDIAPGPPSSLPRALHVLGGAVFFAAAPTPTAFPPFWHQVAMWRSDGTEVGTQRFTQLSGVGDLARLPGLLVYRAGTDLWRTDGTEAGTVLFGNFFQLSYGFVQSGGWLFFPAVTASSGHGLWRTDGTAHGTQVVRGFPENPYRPLPDSLTAGDTVLYFVANDGVHGVEPWRTDGTPAGTHVVDAVPGPSSSGPSSLVTVGDTLLFVTPSDEDGTVWRSDGTPEGTAPLALEIPPDEDSDPFSYFLPTLHALEVEAGRLLLSVCRVFTCTTWVATAEHPVLARLPFEGSLLPLAVAGKRVFVAAKPDGASSGELWAMSRASLSFCGDGVVDAARGETCDDGNAVPDDGCDVTCLPEPSSLTLTGAALATLLGVRARRATPSGPRPGSRGA